MSSEPTAPPARVTRFMQTAIPLHEIDANTLPWPRPAYSWWVVAVLLITYVFSFADRSIISLLVPYIRADFSVTDTQVSLLAGFVFALVVLDRRHSP